MRRQLSIGIVVGLGLGACSADPRPSDGQSFGAASLDDGPSSSDAGTDEDPSTAGDGDGDGDGDPGTGDGDGDPTPLPCDADFVLTPNPPGTGSLLNVAFTDLEPLAYVDLVATGPGAASLQWAGITTDDPWTWNWTVTDLTPGVWTFTFGAGEAWVALASCQAQVVDTGMPPDPPMGACAGKVCGDDDGQGGTCDTCPMVGECLDPPSPYGPNGPEQWSCLDNASCNADNGSCRIWCPGEPCNNAEHPDGCPQGVETCWVDASFGSYEEACKSCCESRFHQPTMEYACWDQAFNLCRYPTDCGLPLW